MAATGWVIVILHDGPVRLEVYGDHQGQPYADRASAERAKATWPTTGTSYSVYVANVGRL